MASLTIQEKIDNEAKKIEQAKARMQKLVAQSKSQLKKDETSVSLPRDRFLPSMAKIDSITRQLYWAADVLVNHALDSSLDERFAWSLK